MPSKSAAIFAISASCSGPAGTNGHNGRQWASGNP
jgi:hypothetical protein